MSTTVILSTINFFAQITTLTKSSSWHFFYNLVSNHCGMLSMCPWAVNAPMWCGLWAIAAKNGDITWPGPGNKPNVGGNRGLADKRSFSNSASCSLFAFALRFWNHIFTCNTQTKHFIIIWYGRNILIAAKMVIVNLSDANI